MAKQYCYGKKAFENADSQCEYTKHLSGKEYLSELFKGIRSTRWKGVPLYPDEATGQDLWRDRHSLLWKEIGRLQAAPTRSRQQASKPYQAPPRQYEQRYAPKRGGGSYAI